MGLGDFALAARKILNSYSAVHDRDNCCLLQQLSLFADKIAAVRIRASGTRAKFTKEIAFQDSTHFVVDAHIHNVDLQNPTQLLLLPGDTKCFSSKSSQAIQLCYRVFLIALSSSLPG